MRDKIFRPKDKYYTVDIDGLKHKIRIKANPWSAKIIILVDDIVVIEEVIKGKKRHLFYPMKIGNKEVVVELTDEGFNYAKNIYIDSISIKTGDHIDKAKKELQKKIDAGLFKFLFSDIKKVLKASCCFFYVFILLFLESIYKKEFTYDLKVFIYKLIQCIVFSVLLSFCWFTVDWFSSKHELKKWDSQYHRL